MQQRHEFHRLVVGQHQIPPFSIIVELECSSDALNVWLVKLDQTGDADWHEIGSFQDQPFMGRQDGGERRTPG